MSTILVAGVPRSGKSTLARMIARELGMSYFPVDALVSSLGTLHPELGLTHLTSNPSEVSRILSPMLVELHSHLSYERAATVLDAYQCFPLDLHSAARANGIPITSEAAEGAGDALRVIYVGYPRALPDEKVARIRRHARTGDWNEELDDASLTRIVERYITESRAIAEQCAALSWEFVDTGDDFEGAVRATVERQRRLRRRAVD